MPTPTDSTAPIFFTLNLKKLDFKPPLPFWSFQEQNAAGADAKSVVATRGQHTAADWCLGDTMGKDVREPQAPDSNISETECCVWKDGLASESLVLITRDAALHENPPQEEIVGGDDYVYGLGGDGFTSKYLSPNSSRCYIQYV